MKHIYTLVAALLFGGAAIAQTIWDGPAITFTKVDFADHTLDENQDQMTDNVHITRGANKGLFNIAVESSYSDFESPVGTEWAYGSLDDWSTLTYTNWEALSDSEPPTMIDQTCVVHLITDDIYLELTLLSWTQGQGGGVPSGSGFSYERTTGDAPTGIAEATLFSGVSIFPNPATDAFMLEMNAEKSGLARVFITDVQGRLVQERQLNVIAGNQQIQMNAKGLASGKYILSIAMDNQRENQALIIK